MSFRMIMSKDRLASAGPGGQQPCLALLLAFNTTPPTSRQKPPRPWWTVTSFQKQGLAVSSRQCLSPPLLPVVQDPLTPPSPIGYSLGRRVVELVLPRAAKAGLHTVVGPKPPDDPRQILREDTLLLSSAGQCKQLPGIVLGTVGRDQPITGAHPTLPGQGREASRMGPTQAWVVPGFPGQDLRWRLQGGR